MDFIDYIQNQMQRIVLNNGTPEFLIMDENTKDELVAHMDDNYPLYEMGSDEKPKEKFLGLQIAIVRNTDEKILKVK